MSTSLLSPGVLDLDLSASDANTAIDLVAKRLAAHPEILDFPKFLGELLARERLTSTVLGHGIAIPHARTNSVRQIVVAAGRSRDGVWFESGQQKVHLLFVIGVPPHMVREYLAVLSDLTRRLKDPTVRDRLMDADCPETFLATLNVS